MRLVRGFLLSLLLLSVLAVALSAHAASPSFSEIPEAFRPGKYHNFSIDVPSACDASLVLLDGDEQVICTIFTAYPLVGGINSFSWDGRTAEQTAVPEGIYTLRLQTSGGTVTDAELPVGAAYPMIVGITQSDYVVTDEPILVSLTASEAGTIIVQLKSQETGSIYDLLIQDVAAGEVGFEWNGAASEGRLPAGDYALMLTLRTPDGDESLTEYVFISIEQLDMTEENGVVVPIEAAAARETMFIQDPTPPPAAETMLISDLSSVTDSTSVADPTSVPSTMLSPPYSTVQDDTFWSMTPGELDDSAIWDIMTQPITVYDGGIKAGAKSHAYMMENPDGSGEKVAQLHTQSQGVHVIGEPNEYGYVLVEAFSNYDRDYWADTDEKMAHAFELKRGYVLAKNLKTVQVQTDMALLVDMLTQRMYLFIDGVRVTEFLVSTGTWEKQKDMIFETVPGEFITVSHTGSLVDGNMTSDMAIRINGGILFHEVPHKTNKDGTYDYSSFEAYLGQKKSHGCIRVQRLKTPEGYNQRWLWENFKRGAPYKVIIWSDRNRVDSPTTWQANPKN